MRMVRIEFFGVARLRAGVETATIAIDADEVCLGDVMASLACQFPALAETSFDGGRLLPGCSVNVNGELFITDPQTLLPRGASLLIMSADAGG